MLSLKNVMDTWVIWKRFPYRSRIPYSSHEISRKWETGGKTFRKKVQHIYSRFDPKYTTTSRPIINNGPQQVRVMNNNNKDKCMLRLILPTVNTDVLALTKVKEEEGQEGDRQNLSSRICQVSCFRFNFFMTFQHPGIFLYEFYSPICEVVFT